VQTTWPEPVERVAGFLREAGAEARLEEFGSGTPTARDAARAVGCTPERIVKSLVLVCDGRSVLVLVPGDRRADTAKVAAATGADEVRVAAPAEVEAATGFTPGGVAPFPLPDGVRVLVERSLLAHDRVWIGAGSPSHLASLKPTELLRLAHAAPIDAVLDYGPNPPRKGDALHA
jgi:Cys-tRNA(Pro) deacylase